MKWKEGEGKKEEERGKGGKERGIGKIGKRERGKGKRGKDEARLSLYVLNLDS